MTHENQNTNTNNPPSPRLDTAGIITHLRALAATHQCRECETVAVPVIRDVADLFATIALLYDDLAAARLEAANLKAAMRAALGAAADGETDPLDYLRWELPDTESPTAPYRGRR